MRMPLAIIVVTAAVALTGCANNGLKNIRAQGPGPDEFAVLPVKPLTSPKDYQYLPAPTPGGGNLTDPNPVEDGIVALGGSAAALNATAIPSSDAALVTASSRYGVPANTRQVVQEEDARFRERQGRLSSLRLLPVDRYEQAYRSQSIDPDVQNDALRRQGYATPSAPPPFNE